MSHTHIHTQQIVGRMAAAVLVMAMWAGVGGMVGRMGGEEDSHERKQGL